MVSWLADSMHFPPDSFERNDTCILAFLSNKHVEIVDQRLLGILWNDVYGYLYSE